MKFIVAFIMLVINFSTISRAFIRSLPQHVHRSINRSGYSSSFRVLFTALGSSDDAQQAFDQLPPEVKRGFGGQTRKKKIKPTASTTLENGNDNTSESTTIEEIPAPPLVFSLGSHLTGKRVDLTWQYSFDAVVSSSTSSSSSELPFINPWGPVRKSAELKAIRVLLQPGEFISCHYRSNNQPTNQPTTKNESIKRHCTNDQPTNLNPLNESINPNLTN